MNQIMAFSSLGEDTSAFWLHREEFHFVGKNIFKSSCIRINYMLASQGPRCTIIFACPTFIFPSSVTSSNFRLRNNDFLYINANRTVSQSVFPSFGQGVTWPYLDHWHPFSQESGSYMKWWTSPKILVAPQRERSVAPALISVFSKVLLQCVFQFCELLHALF